MDFNSSLDDIIKRRNKPTRNEYRQHSNSSSRGYSTSYNKSTSASTRYDSRQNGLQSKTDLRSRIGRTRTSERTIDRTDLRGRIGKRSALSISSLPNRQQRYQSRSSSHRYSNNSDDDNKQQQHDTHSIIITKPVYHPNSHKSTITTSTISTPIGFGIQKNTDVDPASIVITKTLSKSDQSLSSSTNMQNQEKEELQKQRQEQQHEQINRAEQSLQQYLKQQQELQERQQRDQQVQQQLQNQQEQIEQLKRQLEISRQSLTQQHTMPHVNSGNFSFMPISGRPPSNTVILSNLDPAATVNDVQVACGTFGPVVRCELVRDHLGRSCGEAEIEFLDHRSALDCIARYDNEKVDHRIIRATLRHPPAYPTVRSTIAPTRSGYRTTSQVLYTKKQS